MQGWIGEILLDFSFCSFLLYHSSHCLWEIGCQWLSQASLIPSTLQQLLLPIRVGEMIVSEDSSIDKLHKHMYPMDLSFDEQLLEMKPTVMTMFEF